MEIESVLLSDDHRKLCIKKDLFELNDWIETLTIINEEIDYLHVLEKNLIKDHSLQMSLKSVRRKNTLLMAIHCKYEKSLKIEYEYGKGVYDLRRAKEHEKKRLVHSSFTSEFARLKKILYQKLCNFKRR